MILLVGLHAGCGKKSAGEETAARMQKLIYPLSDYAEELGRSGKGQPSEEGFKAYLAGLSKQKLVDLNITNTQELFVSPRDQKPFVINYGFPSSGAKVPVIWEQTGAGGKRYIVYSDTKAEEIDEEAFKKLGPKSKK